MAFVIPANIERQLTFELRELYLQLKVISQAIATRTEDEPRLKTQLAPDTPVIKYAGRTFTVYEELLDYPLEDTVNNGRLLWPGEATPLPHYKPAPKDKQIDIPWFVIVLFDRAGTSCVVEAVFESLTYGFVKTGGDLLGATPVETIFRRTETMVFEEWRGFMWSQHDHSKVMEGIKARAALTGR
ncbi:hypothetical protein LTR53_015219 [Teratosphaeriaceae sp. CCFEE 6253]|nr:hypothetical protein LTR53_015219 [Teratosphaeriaceae sp. CCFEE 6253]